MKIGVKGAIHTEGGDPVESLEDGCHKVHGVSLCVHLGSVGGGTANGVFIGPDIEGCLGNKVESVDAVFLNPFVVVEEIEEREGETEEEAEVGNGSVDEGGEDLKEGDPEAGKTAGGGVNFDIADDGGCIGVEFALGVDGLDGVKEFPIESGFVFFEFGGIDAFKEGVHTAPEVENKGRPEDTEDGITGE